MKRRKKPQKPSQVHPDVNFVMMDVDNPMFSGDHRESQSNPRQVKAAFNTGESYAGLLYGRRSIDREEWEAAGMIRSAYEAMGGAGASAIDYRVEKVDGGQIPSTITDRHLRAASLLKDAHLALGPAGYDLTIKLAGQGMSPRDIAAKERMQKYYCERFKECLNTLAVFWGKKARPMRSFVA